ncbi:type III secretion system inner rod subunit SctI [Escherichia albertii]|uniref:type III secretion system inner rod subunit SctI n=1 Tax=Escherichia albertii TaxID=208962 RepID=UPI0010F8F749|nr:type III secretion system inner rod subunit SctI [Escherichia albertii]
MNISIDQIPPEILRSTQVSQPESELITSDIVDLDSRLSQEVARSAVSSQAEREKIMQALSNPATTTDPAQLAMWQNRLSVYTLETGMYSTLARKGVSAIETLLKA